MSLLTQEKTSTKKTPEGSFNTKYFDSYAFTANTSAILAPI